MIKFRLAPLCGVTDRPFRTICADLGCQCGYTEMISAMGYLCAPKDQPTTSQLLERGESEHKLILQLFGKEPDVVAEAASKLTETGRYDGIDINMGCPAHKIAPSGEGCGRSVSFREGERQGMGAAADILRRRDIGENREIYVSGNHVAVTVNRQFLLVWSS